MIASIERFVAAMRRWRMSVAVIATLAPGAPALASLGQDVASVEDDRAQIQGSLSIVEAQGYTIHEIQAPTGTVVREFVLPGGAVFAVAWHGPFVPNLRKLLGAHFVAFAQAAQAQTAHEAGRRAVLIRAPGLVVETGGQMRKLFGRAYSPELLPQSFREGPAQ